MAIPTDGRQPQIKKARSGLRVRGSLRLSLRICLERLNKF